MVAKTRNQLSHEAVEEEIINSIAIVVTRKKASCYDGCFKTPDILGI